MRKIGAVAVLCFGATSLFVACSSSDDSTSGTLVPDSGSFETGAPDQSAPVVQDASPEDAADASDGATTNPLVDPPPMWCGPPASQPPPIGGTEECPDDKNLPGCGCATAGQQAACWTGFRKNRGLGACKDGMTKCVGNVWGPCEGEKLPDPAGKDGAAKCLSFSIGKWKIANTAPCVWTNDGTTYFAYSTTDAVGGGCTAGDHLGPGQTPAKPWSKSTLVNDTGGQFHLCYRIKVGDVNNPKPADCTLGLSCIDVDYVQGNVEQALPDLPAWQTTSSACAKQWNDAVGAKGYFEMSVSGRTNTCESVLDDTEPVVDAGDGTGRVFARGSY